MGHTRATKVSDAWTEPRLGRLCEVAAAAISPGRRDSGLSVSSRSHLDTDEAEDERQQVAHEFKVVEVDAFASVHDMIHAAIASYGKQATLREIYKACQHKGRIAYKRSGGSRLITHNDHWKSQIRHALYTGDRFARAQEAHDLWTVAQPFSKQQPQTTKVLVRADADATSVNDDSADAQRRLHFGKQSGVRQTRSKHACDEPLLHPAPKQKRSRTTQVAAKTPSPGSSAAVRSRHDYGDAPSGSVAFSNGPTRMLSGSDYSDMGDRAASASAFQPYSCDTSTAAGTPVAQHEGEDESSHNDTCMQVLPQMYMHDGMPTSYEPGLLVQPHSIVHHGLPMLDVHPYFTECHDAHQIVASSMMNANNSSRAHCSDTNQSADTPLYQPPNTSCQAPHQTPHRTPLPPQQNPNSALCRSMSAEAESPAETQVYSLRSRLAPRVPTEQAAPQQNPIQPQAVHSFFLCHNQVQRGAAGGSCQPSSMLHSCMPESPPIRRAVAKQGVAGKPPVLPRNGRTHSLLAAAQKAQAAAFSRGASALPSEQYSSQHKQLQGVPKDANHWYSQRVDDASAAEHVIEPGSRRCLRSGRLISSDDDM